LYEKIQQVLLICTRKYSKNHWNWQISNVHFATKLIPDGLQSITRKDMPKRKRVAVLFVLPFAIFIWLIGWCMRWTMEKKVTQQGKSLKIK